jgi:hypothetical protein
LVLYLEAMMSGKKRTARRVNPGVESLEGRKLLSVSRASASAALPPDVVSFSKNEKQLQYFTTNGTHVLITLLGSGTLKGSTLNADGSLNIRFSGTNFNSRIQGVATGGPGHAPLATIADLGSPSPASSSATGSEALNVVHMKSFDLISGGAINLMGGINDVYLRSIGADAQLHLQALPDSESTLLRTPQGFITANAQAAANQNAQGSTTTIAGQIVVTNSTGAGSGSAAGTSGPLNQNEIAPGVNLQVATSVGGAPLGVPPLGNAQIFGFDTTSNMLIRFDSVTGQQVGTPIAVPVAGAPMTGVGLGRNNGHLVALVGEGTTIFAFDAVTGAAVGSFTTTSLASIGLKHVSDIGSNDTATYVSDATAGPLGEAVAIDVTASLANGFAVPTGQVFTPAREFELAGGLTGVAGSSNLYALGAAHFDTFQPDQTQLGVLTFTTATAVPRETARTAVPGVNTPFINVGPPGSILVRPVNALGSIDASLAIDMGVRGTTNEVLLYKPSTLALVGRVDLQDSNLLAGLSESFHPEIAGGTLIDVTGTLKRFLTHTTKGVVINDNGTTNLIAIHEATDTTAVGRPLNHALIPIRNNVQLISMAARGNSGKSMRNGVTVDVTSLPIGPLVLP